MAKKIHKRILNRFNEIKFWKLRTRLFCSPRFLSMYVKNNFKAKTLLTYPKKPEIYHVLYEICKYNGWKITDNLSKKADLAIYFEDTTVRERDEKIEAYAKNNEVLNIHSTDIRKSTVDVIFKEVFGYEMTINPETYTGKCVRKSDTNAVHDGKVLQCPTPKEEGYVYQKLIDTNLGDGRVMDLRIHIFKDSIPFLLKRYKSIDDIFHITIDAEMAETDELLSKEEQEKVLEYCKRIGVDYGELDALKSKKDGRLYIVDVNNTPAGPIGPIYNDKDKYCTWLTRISDAFEKYLVT